MTLIVLALDALDPALVEYWDIDTLRLNNHREIETFANMREDPYTPEVWATVATGLPPTEHGVTDEGTSEWTNPLIDFLSRFTGILPLRIRATLGNIAEETTGAQYSLGKTNMPTIFDGDGRVVHTWPGAGPSEDVVRIWDLMKPHQGNTQEEFRRTVLGIAIQQFAWAREMLNHNVVLAGTHIHTLDVCGHAYAENESRYKDIYDWITKQVSTITQSLGDDDELLIVSDHGINTGFCEVRDKHPGSHSFRAFASSTTTDPLPSSVFEVKNWVDKHVEVYETRDDGQVDLPEDTLRELGYIE